MRSVQNPDSGLLPEIDYDGVEATLEQWQSHFYPARRGVRHTALAIKEGRRGADLIPAIMRDCRAWMFTRPDMYVSLASTQGSYLITRCV